MTVLGIGKFTTGIRVEVVNVRVHSDPAKSKENTLPEEQVIPEGQAAPVEGTTTLESATGDSNEPTEGEPKAKGGFQRRIDKLTREKADAARETEYWRQQALRTSPTETKETPEAKSKPKETDFQTHAEYVEALTDYKVTEKVKEFKAEQNAEKAKAHQQTVEHTYRDRLQEYRAATPDFDEVLADATFDVGQAVLNEIYSHEHGPALAYFLAKNTDEAERLSKLPALALAREVGRMESRFTTAPATKPAKVSSAPPPPNPVTKSSSTTGFDPHAADADPAKYREWRRKTFPNSDR